MRKVNLHAWEATSEGARRRTRPPRLIAGHWTGGEAGTRTAEDDGARVVAVLRARTPPLSIHFVIGYDGTVYECADPETVVAYHAGAVNDDAIGIEVVNVGFGESNPRGRAVVVRDVRGRPFRQYAFTEAQLDAWVELCDALAMRFEIPRQVPGRDGKVFVDRLSKRETRVFRGGLEHLNVSSKKPDAGGQLIGRLHECGWALVDNAAGGTR